jgi:hypothetical protein
MIRQIRVLLIVLLLLVMSARSVIAAPPYKITISGPGIDGEVEIWLATDLNLSRQLDSGLTPDTPIDAPSDLKLFYDINWYFGRCWVSSTPCTEDPDVVTVHHSRYGLEASSGTGYISHDSDTGAWAGYNRDWYPISDEFNQTMQLLLIEIYAGVRP